MDRISFHQKMTSSDAPKRLQWGAASWIKTGTPIAPLRGPPDGRCWLPKEQRPTVNKKIMCLKLMAGRGDFLLQKKRSCHGDPSSWSFLCGVLSTGSLLPSWLPHLTLPTSPHPELRLLSSSTGHSYEQRGQSQKGRARDGSIKVALGQAN